MRASEGCRCGDAERSCADSSGSFRRRSRSTKSSPAWITCFSGAASTGFGEAACAGALRRILDKVGLTDRARSRVKTLSGGMKRRLNIAAGLLHAPRLVFMDEPTVGIDPQSRRSVLDLILQLKSEGTTILYTTHYMAEAEELSDRVGIIDHGKLLAVGTCRELAASVGGDERLRVALAGREEGERLTESLRAMPGLSVENDGARVTVTAPRVRPSSPAHRRGCSGGPRHAS